MKLTEKSEDLKTKTQTDFQRANVQPWFCYLNVTEILQKKLDKPGYFMNLVPAIESQATRFQFYIIQGYICSITIIIFKISLLVYEVNSFTSRQH